MNVLDAYRDAWDRRGFCVPVYVGVRLLTLAVVGPLTAVVVALAISLSGRPALTDQDIAWFFVSPIGFPVFVALAALLFLGSVLGLAAMTADLHDPGTSGLSAVPRVLGRIGARLPSLLRFAAVLVLRVMAVVLPFALVGLFAVQRLIGQYDINYYLAERPPEAVKAAGVIAVLAALAAAILIPLLASWAVALHAVLFGGLPAAKAFVASRESMRGRRLALVRDIGLWALVRLALSGALAFIFGFLLREIPATAGGGFRATLTIAVILASAWALADLVVAAVGLGAIASILDARYRGPVVRTSPGAPAARPLGLAGRVVALFALAAANLAAAGVIFDSIRGDRPVAVIGHRGAAGSRPENTLSSIEKAVVDGADWVEIDVQETADGQVVVVHDSDFMKLAGVDLKVWNATMSDLAGIDVGGWYGPDYADQRVPRLADALAAVKGRAKLLIELKYYGHDVDLAARTVALVEAAGMQADVATMSLKIQQVERMRDLRPAWPVGVLAASAVGDLAGLDADFLAVRTAIVGPRLIRAAHAQGKAVYVWTVNDPLEMSAMISLGVDGIITDEPALAREVIDTRNRMTDAERLFALVVARLDLSEPERSPRDDSP